MSILSSRLTVASAYGAVSPEAMRQRTLDMFYTYILKSLIKDWYYVGHTSNLEQRVNSHNLGRNRSTKPYRPFEIIYSEEFSTKGDSFKREMQIKSYRHGEAFKKLINK